MIRVGLMCAFAAMGWAQTAATWPAFEVATVKINKPESEVASRISRGPGAKNGKFNGQNLTLGTLVSYAYEVMRFQTTGPAWIDSDRFNIEAKLPEGVPDSQAPAMLRALLEERFKLQVHREPMEQNIYAMVVDKGGAKFLGAHPGDPFTPHVPEGQAMQMTNGAVYRFGEAISPQLGRPVVDETGIKGEYRLVIVYASAKADAGAAVPGPDLFTAVREQLGLRLEPRRQAVEMLRVDRAERVPAEN